MDNQYVNMSEQTSKTIYSTKLNISKLDITISK